MKATFCNCTKELISIKLLKNYTIVSLSYKSLSIGINLVHHKISLETDAVYTVRIIFNIAYGICMMNKTGKFTV